MPIINLYFLRVKTTTLWIWGELYSSTHY